jgi:hypothetical protein
MTGINILSKTEIEAFEQLPNISGQEWTDIIFQRSKTSLLGASS